MKKAIVAIMMVVVLISCMSLSASAATVDATTLFTPTEAYVLTDINSGSPTWLQKTDLEWVYASNSSIYAPYYTAAFGSDLVGAPYGGFRLKFQGKPNQDGLLISKGYYAVMTIFVKDTVTSGSYLESTHYCNVGIYDDLGNVYTVRSTPVISDYGNDLVGWNVSLVSQIGTGVRTYISNLLIESDMPSENYGESHYNVLFRFEIAETATEAQRIHEEQLQAIEDAADLIVDKVTDSIGIATDDITANQDANTDKIIANDDENTNKITDSVGDAADDITANQDANTDKIIENENQNHEDLKNGWEAPGDGDPGGDVDDLTDKMGDADSAALGGKSDADIQNEIGGVLSADSLPGISSSLMVSSLFDKLLKAFGNEYQALLMLSLILGLAAFLVGRQYRAKGD